MKIASQPNMRKAWAITLVLLFSLLDLHGASARTVSARLIIPAIKVNATIQEMGMTTGGAMAVPGNRFDVGWYSPGTRPGITGSAVIGGHNFWNGSGVFRYLDRLKKGDIVSVVDNKGVKTSFIVREMKTFNADDTASGIFTSATGIHLNLITCSGLWNPKTQSYTTRLVIYTDLVKT